MEHGGLRPGAGRPVGSKASHTLEAEALRQYIIEQVVKNKEAIIASLIKHAIEGKIPAAKELLERALGKPMETLEMKNNEISQRWRDVNEVYNEQIEKTKELTRLIERKN